MKDLFSFYNFVVAGGHLDENSMIELTAELDLFMSRNYPEVDYTYHEGKIWIKQIWPKLNNS